MLTIQHTNDLHGAVGLLPRLAAPVARSPARGRPTPLLDVGAAGLARPAADLGGALMGGSATTR